MKRILLLSCWILALSGWSLAQGPFFRAMRHAPSAVSEGAVTAAPPVAQAVPEPVMLPAGTHLLMKLTSPLHTTSSTPGTGIYLETSFPVIADDRVVIPEHTRVLGVVESSWRPGRVKGRAQMRFRFTELIFPDDHVLTITGSLQSLPGSAEHRTVDREGTLEPVDQIDSDVYTVAGATGAGVLVGSLSHTGIGVAHGALIGAGLGLAKVLFTRGDEISLPVGTQVEMVLQRPLTLGPKS